MMLIIYVHNPKRLCSVHILTNSQFRNRVTHDSDDTRNTRKDGPRPTLRAAADKARIPSPSALASLLRSIMSHAKCIGCMRALSYQQSFVTIARRAYVPPAAKVMHVTSRKLQWLPGACTAAAA